MTATARDRHQGTKTITEKLQKTIDELHVHAAHEPHELIVIVLVCCSFGCSSSSSSNSLQGCLTPTMDGR